MTLQEIFDRVATHLLTQKAKSVNTAGECMYRGDGGLRCAVGCLIPDYLYETELENVSVTGYCVARALEIALGMKIGENEMSLLFGVQKIHDSSEPVKWAALLIRLARPHNLSHQVVLDLTK